VTGHTTNLPYFFLYAEHFSFLIWQAASLFRGRRPDGFRIERSPSIGTLDESVMSIAGCA
jgi:hypothetical protein